MYYTNINDYERLLNKNRLHKKLLSKNDDPSPDNGFSLTIVVTLFLLLP